MAAEPRTLPSHPRAGVLFLNHNPYKHNRDRRLEHWQFSRSLIGEGQVWLGLGRRSTSASSPRSPKKNDVPGAATPHLLVSVCVRNAHGCHPKRPAGRSAPSCDCDSSTMRALYAGEWTMEEDQTIRHPTWAELDAQYYAEMAATSATEKGPVWAPSSTAGAPSGQLQAGRRRVPPPAWAELGRVPMALHAELTAKSATKQGLPPRGGPRRKGSAAL